MAPTMADERSYPLLSVEAARERILAQVRPPRAESAPLLSALGRVLAEDVVSALSIPPLANSAMDGYVVRAADLAGAAPAAPVRLRVVGQVAAGRVWPGALGAGQAVRIMTGAPLPAGADAIVRFEDAQSLGDEVLLAQPVRAGRDVRAAGEDVCAGQCVLHVGALLRPQEIGMLAALGRPHVPVARRPRVAVLSTGDEVAPVDAPLAPGQIHDSNSYGLCALVTESGGEALHLGATPDREEALTARLRQALSAEADIILTSGGVSVGDFDLTKRVLLAEGRMDFWWVNMRPGRPLAFGTLNGIPLLALPGNPVAAMLTFYLFARPAIQQMLGLPPMALPRTLARLRAGVTRKDGRRHYLRVRLQRDADGVLEAELTGDQGSGILLSMVAADGLAVIPEQCDHLEPGQWVQVLLWPTTRIE